MFNVNAVDELNKTCCTVLPALGDKAIFGWLGLLEDIDMIVGHLLLSNENLLAPIDHKVATLQQHALCDRPSGACHTKNVAS